MSDHEADIRTVLWRNIGALMADRWGGENLTRLSREADVAPATATRLRSDSEWYPLAPSYRIRYAARMHTINATRLPAQPAEPIVSYKGFDQKLQCRDHQFVVGETYEHKGAVKACEGGFHACEYPLHVFAYYKPSRSRFAVVEQSGKLDREDGDNKVASSRLTIKAELDLAGLIKAAIKYTMDRCTPAEGAVSDQDNESVSANGVRKAATASGYGGAATASGNCGAATASGNSGAATASGYGGAATASGDYGAAMASGRNGKASGKNGCALFLVRRDSQWRITHAFAGIVGRDGLQADTFYTLDESGKPVEAK